LLCRYAHRHVSVCCVCCVSQSPTTDLHSRWTPAQCALICLPGHLQTAAPAGQPRQQVNSRWPAQQQPPHLHGCACTVANLGSFTPVSSCSPASGYNQMQIWILANLPSLLCDAVPCHAMPCRPMPCHAVPCHAAPCHAMPCRAVPCRPMPCHAVHTCPVMMAYCCSSSFSLATSRLTFLENSCRYRHTHNSTLQGLPQHSTAQTSAAHSTTHHLTPHRGNTTGYVQRATPHHTTPHHAPQHTIPHHTMAQRPHLSPDRQCSKQVLDSHCGPHSTCHRAAAAEVPAVIKLQPCCSCLICCTGDD
jgi:hypothetical protein